MDHAELGGFLKSRRGRLRPADVGLPDGGRRRVPGLRRDEVARLADMSVDYYIELEQGRGQSPSQQILTALARALRLSADESTHLYHLAGHQAPLGAEPVQMQRALLELLDRFEDTPAMIITDLHEIRVQNQLCEVLIGSQSGGRGVEASFVYQWFANPVVRGLYPVEDHAYHSGLLVADLRAAAARRGRDALCAELIRRLREASEEFTGLWDVHDVSVRHEESKRIVHPALGVVEVSCNSIYTADVGQRLLWMVPAEAGVLERMRGLDAEQVWGGRSAARPGSSVTDAASVVR
ncbi:helix-turn-helix transcriptional regulator [Streptomyces sp. AK02-01A]|uniref:helix-turn-helix transcriptional regulator n=1 Tax=Streptomyces sp. AK02-01A TaxID=3028648 RepID=UPI0029AC5CBB|nr:helix-turn-helix transcriptional regulator [Streptomyces sp. AK02-01A]MDX3853349.1 helix-turn-helix transcriptional regulator [Streptomyces sp. AK02-01A]